MKRKFEEGEFTFILLLLVISMVLFILSLRMYVDTPVLSGPATFPLLTTILMIIILSSILWGSKKYNKFAKDRNILEKLKATLNYLFPQKIIQLIALIIIYVLVLPYLGFIITTFLFLFLAMLLFSKKNILQIFTISTGSIVCILIVFKYIFQIVLP